MRHYLDLLRKLHGLGCLDAHITLSLDAFPSDGMLTIKVQIAHDKEVLTKVDRVPIHEIEKVEYAHTGEMDGYLLGKIYEAIRVAMNRRHASLTRVEGDVRLQGYCSSCKRVVTYAPRKK
jgi:hypothetical protein